MHFSEAFLEENFDNFEFFDPECRDRRVREVWMRTKRCLEDPGFAEFAMHPNNWMTGSEKRRRRNNELSG